MKSAGRDCRATRDRILEAASGLFAEKGWRDTTVAEICRMAEANIAAVSYHFGGKRKLYAEAWRHAHEAMLRQCPPNGGIPAGTPPEERLRRRISALLQRALSKEAVEAQIMRNEMANPTGLLDQVINDTIRPEREATQAILRELLGDGADDQTIALCEVSVMVPCMHIVHRHLAEKHHGLGPIFTEAMMGGMTDHFTAFAMAGIREARRRLKRRTAAHQSKAGPRTREER